MLRSTNRSRGSKPTATAPPSPSDAVLSPVTKALRKHRVLPNKPLPRSHLRRESLLHAPKHVQEEEISAAVSTASHVSTEPQLVLGSASLPRKRVLEHVLGPARTFAVEVADIDERAIRHTDPRQLVQHIAQAKATAILARPHAAPIVLITADQVVVGADGIIREKPLSADEARVMLRSYAGAYARTVSAVVVTDSQSGRQTVGVDECRIVFSPSLGDDAAIERVLQPAQALSIEAVLQQVEVNAKAKTNMGASTTSTGETGITHTHSNGNSTSGSGRRRLSGRSSARNTDDGTVENSNTLPIDGGETCSVYASAGALMIEHPEMAHHIIAIEGDIDSIQGLPLKLTQLLLSQISTIELSDAKNAKRSSSTRHKKRNSSVNNLSELLQATSPSTGRTRRRRHSSYSSVLAADTVEEVATMSSDITHPQQTQTHRTPSATSVSASRPASAGTFVSGSAGSASAGSGSAESRKSHPSSAESSTSGGGSAEAAKKPRRGSSTAAEHPETAAGTGPTRRLSRQRVSSGGGQPASDSVGNDLHRQMSAFALNGTTRH